MKEYYIQTNMLTKKYGNTEAVSKLSIHVNKGEIYGLIGPNGAGKTTLMKMISGLAAPTGGEINIMGGEDAQNRIGCLVESPGLYGNLNAYDNMMIKAKALGLYDRQEIKRLIDFVGLGNVPGKKTKNYSLGMKQRLGIAMALIGHPDLIILDEPINGLDPQGIIEVRELILKLCKEQDMTIIISSHILEELSKIATQFAIIKSGKLIMEISSDEIKKTCGERLEIVTDEIGLCTTVLEEMGINNYLVENDTTVYAKNCSERVAEITKRLVDSSVPVTSIGLNSMSLEEFYLNAIEKGV